MKKRTGRDDKSKDATELRQSLPSLTLNGSHDGIMAQRKLRENVILLVEDNRGDVVLLKRAFSMAGLQHDFLIARDGQAALSILRGGIPRRTCPSQPMYC